MSDSHDFWNELAPDAGDQFTGPHCEDTRGYEGRHRSAEVLGALDSCAQEWLLLVDYVDDLRRLCLERGLSDTVVESLLEVFVRSATCHSEVNR
jgi:hypothetical protein